MFETMKSSLYDGFVVARALLIVGVPSAIFLFHVWNEYRIVQIGYEIAEVTREHRVLLEENKKLSIEAAVQGRTDRMAALAREQFGLEQVRAHQIVNVRVEAGDEHAVEHASLGY